MSSISLTDDDIQRIAQALGNAGLNQQATPEPAVDRGSPHDLPREIMESLEEASRSQLKNFVQQFNKQLISYDAGQWTQPGATNQQFVRDLKRAQLDVHTVTQRMYCILNRLSEVLRTDGLN